MNRRLLLLGPLLGWLLACSAPEPWVIPLEGASSYPPTQFVDVLDQAPDRPYEELALIQADGVPGMTYSQVQARIREQARQLGADAVILEDLSRATPREQQFNPTTGTYETTGGEIVPRFRGVVIKYRS
ncbi:MAG: hypothetical protein R3310_07890 [Candidatus Competibacteraceae bacterium]|nr:hypothetical protein [Candidatus Competibacteraceae bacterium]